MDRKRILIVDDDLEFRKTLADVLCARGYDVRSACDGKTALSLLADEEPDLLMIDLKLDDIPGLELLRVARSKLPPVECIIITGHASQESAIEAGNLGAFGYIVKPCDMEQLLLMIARAFDKIETRKALEISERRFRQLFEQSKDAILIYDSDGNVIDANESACNLLGYSRGEILSLNEVDLHPEEIRVSAEQVFEKFIAEGKNHPEIKLQRKDGSVMDVEVSISIIDEDGKSLVQAIIRDIIECKRREAELLEYKRRLEETIEELHATQSLIIQQERLSALGQLASGIAHDFNNSLAPILGYTELMISFPDILNDRKKALDFLRTMNIAAKDAAHIVERLREFYRKRDEEDRHFVVDLNSIIRQAIDLSRPKWRDQALVRGAEIEISTVLSDISPIMGSESELREMLINLIFNAADAIEGKGMITLSTRQRKGKVILAVSDNGRGMSEEVRRRCFEPMFSTKGEKGTGLGLSMVYGIVKRHNGDIHVESRLGVGTTFTIEFPLTVEDEKESGMDSPEHVSRSLHVLVVDDDDSVRRVITEYLAALGHMFEEAHTGKDALTRCRIRNFDLVITDMAMPDMNGVQLAEELAKTCKDMPVIMLTGFGDLIQTSDDRVGNIDLLLGKPVTLPKFREALRIIANKYWGS